MESLEKLLKSKARGGLGEIVQRAQNMDDLAHKLRQRIDPEMAAHVTAVNVREDGELIVIVDSSAWAARARYASVELVEGARDCGADVTRCHVRVGS